MKKFIYSIRDVKSCWINPIVDDSAELARRGFAFACHNSESIMGFAPEDFTLYKIGSFDTETGLVEPCMPEHICNGIEVV